MINVMKFRGWRCLPPVLGLVVCTLCTPVAWPWPSSADWAKGNTQQVEQSSSNCEQKAEDLLECQYTLLKSQRDYQELLQKVPKEKGSSRMPGS